jgi:hypothetical protein
MTWRPLGKFRMEVIAHPEPLLRCSRCGATARVVVE